MKKYLIAVLIVLALMLSAFSSSYSEVVRIMVNTAAADTTPTPEDGTPANGPKDSQRQISDQERFIIGIFELEGTDLAVTSDQAAHLVTLWTSMEEYSQQLQPMMQGTPDGTPAATKAAVEPEDNSEEISALFDQIEAVMTSDQLAAIAALELDQDAITTFMDEQEIEMTEGMQMQPDQGSQTAPQGTPAHETIPAPQGTPAADGSGNGGPGGGQPGEGGPGRVGTQVASSNWIDALIKLLETKVNA